VDEYAAFSDAASEVAARERELMQKSDMVLVSASDLMTKKREFNPRTYMLRHGVDIENFRRAADPQTAISEQISKLPRPILGFHGLIADWVDLELIAKVARLRPDWSIVLIGKADTSLASLDGLPNVHLLGHCAYNKLPESLRGFDVAILPFVNNELTRAANPLKLREYLAAGLPVVAVPIPEVKVFEGEVLLADTAEEYVAHVEKLWAAGQTGPSSARSDSMKNESWAGRAQEAERLLLQFGNNGTGRQDAAR
jgi:glycosyltransferase involved in cell wall biosynthesis